MYFLRLLKQSDKLLHLIAGILMVQCFYILFTMFLSFIPSVVISICVSILIGTGKEVVYDKLMKKGVCSLDDFIATTLGILIETGIIIVDKII